MLYFNVDNIFEFRLTSHLGVPILSPVFVKWWIKIFTTPSSSSSTGSCCSITKAEYFSRSKTERSYPLPGTTPLLSRIFESLLLVFLELELLLELHIITTTSSLPDLSVLSFFMISYIMIQIYEVINYIKSIFKGNHWDIEAKQNSKQSLNIKL